MTAAEPQPGRPGDPIARADMVATTSFGARRCHARSRSGEQCGQAAMHGATVCKMHGGLTPAVQRKAKLRLLELVDPAIATLARELTNSKARPIERVRAAEAILDRAGYGKQMEVTGEEAREMLLQRMLQLRDQIRAEEAARDIEGEVIDGDA